MEGADTPTHEECTQVYMWVDSIPLSRPKKNVARDFSDAVLAAEIVRHFHPRLIDMHNYPSTLAVKQKYVNWCTLVRKVFSRIGMAVTEGEIDSVVQMKPLAVEALLLRLRPALERYVFVPSVARLTSPDRTRGHNYSDLSKVDEVSKKVAKAPPSANAAAKSTHVTSCHALPPVQSLKQPVSVPEFGEYRFPHQQGESWPNVGRKDTRTGGCARAY